MKKQLLTIISFISVSAIAVADDSMTVSPTNTLQADAHSSLLKGQDTKLELKPGVLGRSVEDEVVNSKYAGGTVDIVGERKINDYFSARLSVSVLMMAGSYTNQYSDEGKAPNAVIINEAAVALKPVSFFTLEAGVLLTQFSTLPSNFDALGFPGARESIEVGDDFKTQIYAAQLIPTSDTAAVKPAENGVTTQLLMVGLNFNSDSKDVKNFGISGGVSHFDFKNLNASAATDSRYLGNTVQSAGPQARFMYEFGGYEANGAMSARLSRYLKVILNGAYMKNEKAPELYNKGYLYSLGLATPFMRSELSGAAGYFYNESDTLPASYTSTGKGSNNRFGPVFRVGVENKKEKINGYVQYTRANEIDDMPYTADREIVLLGLEIAYEIL